jgi:ribosomal protein S18 acetylase RimI-like enzyme
MDTEQGKLIELRKDLILPAARTLTLAFKDDPVINYIYPDINEQETKLPYLYQALLRLLLGYAQIYLTSNRVEGVTIWRSSDKTNLPLRQFILSGALWPALKMGFSAAKRMKFFDYIENRRKELVPYPHWYLDVLGVAPEFQGKGFAGKLLRGMLLRIDRDGMPCYLETERERNISFYQHFNFKVIDEFIVSGTSVKLWAMLRKNSAK